MNPTLDEPSSQVSAAPLDGWEQHLHIEHIWGGPLIIDIRDKEINQSKANQAVEEVIEWAQEVDKLFSTYRIDSAISMVRNNLWEEFQTPELVKDVLHHCQIVKILTDGVFNPWAAPGGIDPSGYVKGWAVDVATEILIEHGFTNVSINGAGDIACRGHMSPNTPWRIGIRHPDNNRSWDIIKTLEITNGSVSTSGLYERGNHIINPTTKQNTTYYDSATIVGPDGGLSDALATACLIEGPTCVRWFANLPNWSAYLVKNNQASFFGPAFKTQPSQEKQ